MAVTTINRPFEIVPAYNDCEFLASSDQTAQPNFKYYVTITVSTGESYVIRIAPDPTGKCYFNALPYTRKYIENYYPFGEWDIVVIPTRSFTVNIGEEYGATPTIYTGSNYVFSTWNASLTKKERSVYRMEDYLSYTSDGICKLLNSYRSGLQNSITVNATQDLVFYFYQKDIIFTTLTVGTYDHNSNFIDLITIDTDLLASPQLVCMNVSPASLTQFQAIAHPSRYTSTILPWFSSNVAFYDVSFDGIEYYRVKIVPDCGKFQNYPLMYLNRKGAFDFVSMKGNHSDTLTIEKKFYKGLNQTFEASHEVVIGSTPTNGPNPLSINDKSLNIAYEEVLSLISEPLTQFQIDCLKDLFTSPYVFLNVGEYDYVKYSCKNTEYKIEKELIEKIVQVRATLNAGVTEGRQIE